MKVVQWEGFGPSEGMMCEMEKQVSWQVASKKWRPRRQRVGGHQSCGALDTIFRAVPAVNDISTRRTLSNQRMVEIRKLNSWRGNDKSSWILQAVCWKQDWLKVLKHGQIAAWAHMRNESVVREHMKRRRIDWQKTTRKTKNFLI